MATTLSPAQTHGFLLDGEFISDRKLQPVLSPQDQSVIAQVPQATADDVERAITAAERALHTTRRMPAYERQRILQRVAQTVKDRRDDFAQTIALEAGKPIKAARQEVERAILTFSLAAEEATRIYGETIPLDAIESGRGRWGIVRRFPLGPIAAITPFNFPLNLVGHKLAPAIACGCTVVLKPASQTPLSALMIGQAIQEAGWPAGALNALTMSNETAAPLITDDRLKLLTFTGSSTVGWQLKQQAGKKRVALELGGNAGVIIHSDADVAYAAERCVAGGFGYAGQSCISVQRIYVHSSVIDRFLSIFVPAVQKLRIGDVLDPSTDVGPLISEKDAKRVEEWIAEAVGGGARLLTGGKRRGSYIEPAVLTGTRAQMRVSCMEVFAPLVVVEPYDDFSAAVRRVNDSAYGLQAGVFTRDAKLINDAYEELEVGGVIAGDVPTFRIDSMPYGGTKDSGTGREGVRYAIEEMTERKLLVMAV
jgi:acyl-CoA reductase-like NAD-dependent aldehyde dehydrogenase